MKKLKISLYLAAIISILVVSLLLRNAFLGEKIAIKESELVELAEFSREESPYKDYFIRVSTGSEDCSEVEYTPSCENGSWEQYIVIFQGIATDHHNSGYGEGGDPLKNGVYNLKTDLSGSQVSFEVKNARVLDFKILSSSSEFISKEKLVTDECEISKHVFTSLKDNERKLYQGDIKSYLSEYVFVFKDLNGVNRVVHTETHFGPISVDHYFYYLSEASGYLEIYSDKQMDRDDFYMEVEDCIVKKLGDSVPKVWGQKH